MVSYGSMTDEVKMQYVELQGKEPEDGNFQINGELTWAYGPFKKLKP